MEIYKKYAQRLIARGFAYPDPYTEDELKALRIQAEEKRQPFLFRNHRPETFGTWDGTQPLRFKVPEIKRYTWKDLVRGELSAGEEALDDFILIKGDGYPTYNFAHIVDDIEMGVTHVMRGEEFISSTPKFLAVYEALGVEPPHYATMPVIMAADGKKKLSKRDGAKDILDYKKEGFIPEALVNFLSLLGWNPGDTREVMHPEEITEAFSLDHVHTAGAAFDEVKLRWFNHEHLKKLSDEAFFAYLLDFLDPKTPAPSYLPQVIPLLRERSQTLADAAVLLNGGEFEFLEKEPTPSAELLLQGSKTDTESAKKHLLHITELLSALAPDAFSAEQIKNTVFGYATEMGRSSVLWPMRVALSGREKSPDPFIVAHLLGKEKTLARIAAALKVL